MRKDREDLWFIVLVTLTITGFGLLTILFEMGTLSNLNDLPHRTTVVLQRSTVASGMPGGGGATPPKGGLEDGVGGPIPARAKFEDPTPDGVDFRERFPPPAPAPSTIKNNAPAVTAAKRRHYVKPLHKWPLPAPTDHNPQISECAYIPGVMRESTIVVSIATSLGCN
jgi:hypothetical protein